MVATKCAKEVYIYIYGGEALNVVACCKVEGNSTCLCL